jgi:hypothetical protein
MPTMNLKGNFLPMLRAHPVPDVVQGQPFNFIDVPNQVGILPPLKSFPHCFHEFIWKRYIK